MTKNRDFLIRNGRPIPVTWYGLKFDLGTNPEMAQLHSKYNSDFFSSGPIKEYVDKYVLRLSELIGYDEPSMSDGDTLETKEE